MRWGSADHSPDPWFPLSSQRLKLCVACQLSINPGGKNLSYSPQLQKSHLTFLSTSTFKPQSPCSCFSPGFLWPLACNVTQPNPCGMLTPFLIETFIPLFPPSLSLCPSFLEQQPLPILPAVSASSPLTSRQYFTEFDSLEELYPSSTRTGKGVQDCTVARGGYFKSSNKSKKIL